MDHATLIAAVAALLAASAALLSKSGAGADGARLGDDL
jgi:hypothetical protein